MSDAEKHKEALEGLERVTKIIWCYAAAEKELLEDPTTRDSYSKVSPPLHIELLCGTVLWPKDVETDLEEHDRTNLMV